MSQIKCSHFCSANRYFPGGGEKECGDWGKQPKWATMLTYTISYRSMTILCLYSLVYRFHIKWKIQKCRTILRELLTLKAFLQCFYHNIKTKKLHHCFIVFIYPLAGVKEYKTQWLFLREEGDIICISF